MIKDYSILVGGAAGQGSRKAGLIVAKIFLKLGYYIFIYDDYQSLIRGGHNFSQIRAGEKKVLSHRNKVDILLAMDEDTLKNHQKKLDSKGIIIYNSDKISSADKKAIGISLGEIVKKAGGIPLMENTALISGFAKIAGVEWKVLESVLKKEFVKMQKENLKVAKAAFNNVESLIKVEKSVGMPGLLLTGNEAIALGAVKAGLDFYFAYPMTPASSVLHYLSENRYRFNIGVSQMESEIAVINAALGAAYSGAKTMVGTSGGGFALMVEGFSLAAQAEIPLVVVESQRMSPASGVPTYTAQGDLLFILSAGHGDIVKFVAAPGDAEEAYFWAGKILNLSWKYQTPSILLVDKEISESTFSFEQSILAKVKTEKPLLWNGRGNYLRYKDAQNGISPMAFPGQKNVVNKTTSYEHDEFGIAVEDEKTIVKMQNKRLKKFKRMQGEVDRLEAVKIYGNENSDTVLIVWGSTKGPAKEAAEELGIKMVQPIILQPFPEKQIKKALAGAKKIILAETTAIGQMEKILNSHGIKVDQKILKYDGRPFVAEEIKGRISK